MTSVLDIRGARKRFGDTEALRGLDLTLGRGEWLGLLGPNGAGKTTLIRAIAGRVRLDAGEASLLGTRVDAASSNGAAELARRKLGVVPQDIALYPTFTAQENLECFGKLHGVGGELRDRVRKALAWTGLEDRAKSRVETFSGGMKRRLNIACGVLHRPEVVLLDEPTVGVDPQSRERIWQMLEELRREGASLLLTTHQLDEAERVCDRIVIIDGGKVIAAGTLAELVAATVGPQRTVILTVDAPPAPLDPAWHFDAPSRTIRLHIDNVSGDLPDVLKHLSDAGCRVEDVRIEAPTLHAVFLHLTGRELRE